MGIAESFYSFAVVFCSACAFQLLNKSLVWFGLIPESARSSFSKRWKWQNIFISFIHSSVTGTWSVLCFCQEPKMAEDLISTYTVFSQALVAVSVGYFLYDTFDMLLYNRTKQSYELLLHHAVILCCFGIALMTQRYIGYATVALLVEINSIFLHMRQLMQMLGFQKDNSFYRLNSLINLGTFVGFRIATLAWMTRWIVVNRDLVPLPLYSIGSIGLAIMTVMNIVLLYRLLQSDFIRKKEHSIKSE